LLGHQAAFTGPRLQGWRPEDVVLGVQHPGDSLKVDVLLVQVQRRSRHIHRDLQGALEVALVGWSGDRLMWPGRSRNRQVGPGLKPNTFAGYTTRVDSGAPLAGAASGIKGTMAHVVGQLGRAVVICTTRSALASTACLPVTAVILVGGLGLHGSHFAREGVSSERQHRSS
jgi:hypothetical protein